MQIEWPFLFHGDQSLQIELSSMNYLWLPWVRAVTVLPFSPACRQRDQENERPNQRNGRPEYIESALIHVVIPAPNHCQTRAQGQHAINWQCQQIIRFSIQFRSVSNRKKYRLQTSFYQKKHPKLFSAGSPLERCVLSQYLQIPFHSRIPSLPKNLFQPLLEKQRCGVYECPQNNNVGTI